MAKYDFALFLNNSIVINSFSMKLPDTLVILVDLDHIRSGYLDTLPILCHVGRFYHILPHSVDSLSNSCNNFTIDWLKVFPDSSWENIRMPR